jgi:polysaccharide export outer membrane protein
VRVRIWREPDLSGDFRVDETSHVILPRLGPVEVEHVSLDSLKQYLLRSYQVYLRNPTIEVTLLRLVKVTGAVRNPGAYPADPAARIADIIALAGGVIPDGKQGEVELVRQADQTRVKLRGDTVVAQTAIRSGDQLYVPMKSWISRNPGLLLGTVSVVTGLIWAIGSH